MASVYQPLFRRAWQMTWQARHLWLFGLLAVLLVGGGELNVFIHNNEKVARLGEWASLFRAGQAGISSWRVESLISLSSGKYIVGIILALLGIVLAYCSLIAQGALIRRIERERTKRFTVAEGLEEGRKYLGRVTLLTVGYHLVAGLAWMVVSLPPFLLFLAFGSAGWLTVFLLVAFICLVPAVMVLTLWYRLALVVCVLEDLTVAESLKTAWRVGRANWIAVLELAVMLALIMTVAALIAVSVVVLAVLILFGPLVVFGYLLSAPLVFSVSLMGAMLLFLCGIALFGALAMVFQQASWVFFYRRLREDPPYAKVARLVAALSLFFKKLRKAA